MENPCKQSFFVFTPTSTEEVMKIIGSIDYEKATYSIPEQILSAIPLKTLLYLKTKVHSMIQETTDLSSPIKHQ